MGPAIPGVDRHCSTGRGGHVVAFKEEGVGLNVEKDVFLGESTYRPVEGQGLGSRHSFGKSRMACVTPLVF